MASMNFQGYISCSSVFAILLLKFKKKPLLKNFRIVLPKKEQEKDDVKSNKK
jgi:hypothetical protein